MSLPETLSPENEGRARETGLWDGLAGCRRVMLPTEARMADMLNDILLRRGFVLFHQALRLW